MKTQLGPVKCGLSVRLVLLASCTMMLAGCADIVSDPPTFDEVATVHGISATQASIAWSAGSDDRNSVDELRYLVWLEPSGGDLDFERDPDVTTEEGVLCVTHDDLTPGASYEVLVRARDRGLNRSDNTRTTTLFMPTEETASYESRLIQRAQDLDGLTVASLQTTTAPNLGLIRDDQIDWLDLAGNALSTFTADDIILDVVVHAGVDGRDDLYVLHPNALARYELGADDRYRRDSDFSVSELPVADRMWFGDMDDDGEEDLVFLTQQGVVVIYSASSGDFEFAASIVSGHDQAFLVVAPVDGDGRLDLVVASLRGVEVALGLGDFDFENWTLKIDRDEVRDMTEFALADLSGDGLLDAVALLVDGNDVRFAQWWSQGDGAFSAVMERDLAGMDLRGLTVSDWDGNGADDLILAQVNSNNAVLFLSSGAAGLIAKPRGLGAVASPELVWVGRLNGDAAADFILLDGSEGDLSLLLSKQDR